MTAVFSIFETVQQFSVLSELYCLFFLLVQEFDLGSSSATSQPPTHPHAAVVAAAAALSSGSPQALGAKPKSGVSQHPNVYRNQNKVPDSN